MFDPHDFLAFGMPGLLEFLGTLCLIFCIPLSILLAIVNAIFIVRKKRRDAERSVAQPSEDQNKQPDD